MAILDSVMDTAQKVGKFVCDKAETTKEAVSLEYKAASVRNETNKCFVELGKLVYSSSQTGDDIENKKAELISKIDSLNIQYDQIKEQMTKFKNICLNCGTKNPSKAEFCSKCGKALK